MLAQSIITLATVLQISISLALAAAQPANRESASVASVPASQTTTTTATAPSDKNPLLLQVRRGHTGRRQHLATGRVQLRQPRSLSSRKPVNLASSAPVKELAHRRKKEEKINILLREFPLIYPAGSANGATRQPNSEQAALQRVAQISKEQSPPAVYGKAGLGAEQAAPSLHVIGGSIEMTNYPTPCFFHAIACF